MSTTLRVLVHPGEHLADAITNRGTTRYELAKRTGLSQSAVADIVRGKRAITATTALLFARFFSTSPEFWLNLQAAYDLDRARAELGERLEHVEPLPFRSGE